MTPIDISIGGASGSAWLQTFISAAVLSIVGAASALLATYLANKNQNRRADEATKAREDALARERGVNALMLAEHLEDYVLHCLDVVISYSTSRWNTPYDYDVNNPPEWLDDLPPWPVSLDWRQVGFDVAVEASNFRRRVQGSKEYLREAGDFLDGEDTHSSHVERAADLAVRAWNIAVETRTVGGLGAFVWPSEWKDMAVIDRWRAAKAEREARVAAAIAAARNGPDDVGL